MCGLAGILGARSSVSDIRDMAAAIKPRGPDRQKILEIEGGVLAQSRLAIQDISHAANLPMRDETGRYILLFNGEIYNHFDLRRAFLKDMSFATHSDAETLLRLCIAMGPQQACRLIAGMFAFALVDLQDRQIHLARDQMGEKPLYLAEDTGRRLVFASDISALMRDHALCDEALLDFLVLGFVPQDTTVLTGVQPVPPGVVLSFDLDRLVPVGQAAFEQVPEAEKETPGKSGIDKILCTAIAQNAISDRGVGLFLSGGIDSSIIAYGLASAGIDFHAYTFKAAEKAIDESCHAMNLARKLNFDISEVTAHEDDLRDAFRVIVQLDQPFADPSALATCLMARHIRDTSDIKVILSGDGADELFYGYNRQILHANPLWRGLSSLRPVVVRRAAQRLASGLAGLGHRLTGRRALLKLALLMRNAASYDNVLTGFLAAYAGYSLPVAFTNRWARRFAGRLKEGAQDPLQVDRELYLPGNVLVKSDKILMHFGLEGRSPFCDARVARLARASSARDQIRGGKGKAMLRDVCNRHIPGKTGRRGKQGFSVPLKRWIMQEHFIPLQTVAQTYGGRLLHNAGIDVTRMARKAGGQNSFHVIIWRIAVLEHWMLAHCKDLTTDIAA